MAYKSHRREIMRRAETAAFRGVVRGVNLMHTEAIRLITNTPKTGEVYTRRGIIHQASAPGEPFASDTGNAVRLIQPTYDRTSISASLNFGAAYAAELEFGTQSMAPRPVAGPVFRDNADKVEGFINEELEAEFK